MTISDITICNSALLKLGAPLISSLNDASTEARLCLEQYAKLRDARLQSHLWNFALERVQLAQDATAPVFGFTNQYILPNDYLRVIFLEDRKVRFIIEGQKLLTDASEVKMLYIKQIVDTSKFTPRFAETLSLDIAYDLCMPIREDKVFKRDIGLERDNYLALTRSFDAQEGIPDDLTADVFLEARL